MNAHNSGFTARKDNDLLAQVKNIESTCRKHMEPADWNINVNLMDQLSTRLSAANSAYAVNIDPSHKNHDSAAVKQAAFASLKRTLSVFVNALEGNLKVPDDALDSMQLRPRHPGSHQPQPVPDETPVLTVLTGQHHDITVYVSTLQHGHPTEFLDQKNYYGFLLKYQFEGETNPKEIVSTRKHKTLRFDESKEGQYLKLQAAWLNPRIEPGPWSEEVRELIN
jgi:hypothetical protein